MALLKLDENVAELVAEVLRTAGHDVALARDEDLTGADDERVLRAAGEERRALISFDLHFGDIRRHPPAGTAGVIVFRLRDQRLESIRRAAVDLVRLLSTEPLESRLWILDERRLRIWPGSGAE